jgi:hypothetical protein
VSTKREIPAPRAVGTWLCATASLLLLVCSAYLFAVEGRGWGGGMLLAVGLGLMLAALKSRGATGGVH